jgi:hypothetical protein
MATDDFRVARQAIFDAYDGHIRDMTKSSTRDDVETGNLVIQLMDECIGEVKSLETRYKRKY